MRPHRHAALLALVLTLATGLEANTAAAQNSKLQGTWVLDRAASDDVNAAIANAVVLGGGTVPPGAVERLKLLNRLSPQYVISVDPQNVHIKEGDGPVLTLPADGSTVFLTVWSPRISPCYTGNVRVPCGGISARVTGDALSVMVETDDTRQMKAFLVDGDRLTVVVSVSMQAPRLSPIAYRVAFTRAN